MNLSQPPLLASEQEAYIALRQIRDRLLHPLVRLLAALKVTPTRLSWGSVVLMGLFVVMAEFRTTVSLLLLVLVVLSDMVDGALARHMQVASDKGKFVDILCDNLTFTLGIAGFIVSHFISPLMGLVLVYLMLLVSVWRIVVHARFLPTDWLFKTVPGFLPAAVRGLFFATYAVFAFTGLRYFSWVAAVGMGILLVDAVRLYRLFMKSSGVK